MSDDLPSGDDAIHRAFRALRDGFRTVVVHLVERVDERIRAVEDDERHHAPDPERAVREAALDILNLVTRLVAPERDERPDEIDRNDNQAPGTRMNGSGDKGAGGREDDDDSR